jgi:hypothetical protein
MVISESMPQSTNPLSTVEVISPESRAPASVKQNIRQHAVKANADRIDGMRVLRNRLNINSYSDVK